MGKGFAFGAVAVTALFLLSRNAAAHGVTPGALTEYGGSDPVPDLEGLPSDDLGYYFPDEFVGPIYYEDFTMYTKEQLINGFLHMIIASEHLYPTDLDRAFNIFYGRSEFADMSDHPVLTGEKKGVPLPPEMCRAAGFASGKCVSTAAGGFQLIVPTWQRLRSKGTYLPDFSRESQIEAAKRLLIEIGAMRYLLGGEIEKAIAAASSQWASLPGSKAKQHPKPLSFALARFHEGAENGMA